MAGHNNFNATDKFSESHNARPAEDSSQKLYSSLDQSSHKQYNQRQEQMNGKAQSDVQKHFGECTIVDERSAHHSGQTRNAEQHPLLARLQHNSESHEPHSARGALLHRLADRQNHSSDNGFAQVQQNNNHYEQGQYKQQAPAAEVNTNDMFRPLVNAFNASHRFQPYANQAPQHHELHYYNNEQLASQGFRSNINRQHHQETSNNYNTHRNGNFTSYAR